MQGGGLGLPGTPRRCPHSPASPSARAGCELPAGPRCWGRASRGAGGEGGESRGQADSEKRARSRGEPFPKMGMPRAGSFAAADLPRPGAALLPRAALAQMEEGWQAGAAAGGEQPPAPTGVSRGGTRGCPKLSWVFPRSCSLGSKQNLSPPARPRPERVPGHREGTCSIEGSAGTRDVPRHCLCAHPARVDSLVSRKGCARAQPVLTCAGQRGARGISCFWPALQPGAPQRCCCWRWLKLPSRSSL